MEESSSAADRRLKIKFYSMVCYKNIKEAPGKKALLFSLSARGAPKYFCNGGKFKKFRFNVFSELNADFPCHSLRT